MGEGTERLCRHRAIKSSPGLVAQAFTFPEHINDVIRHTDSPAGLPPAPPHSKTQIAIGMYLIEPKNNAASNL